MKEDDKIRLCHATQDRTRVIELHAHLERAGLHPSIGEADPPPPVDWDREIQQTMQALSKRALQAGISRIVPSGAN